MEQAYRDPIQSGSFLIPLSYYPHSRSAKVKRFVDVSGSYLGILILLPLCLLIALVIKATSKGPVIYSQTRVGTGGRTFKLYKFRSMIADADALKTTLATQNEASGPVFKMRSDPRITKVGAFLRKFSLDELPQLWNVIKGDMSIVGPRPPLPKEVMQYKPWQLRRLSVPQGLTCFWQISGRSNISFEDWVHLDLRYIDNWSLTLDIKIIAQTFVQVLRGTGAY